MTWPFLVIGSPLLYYPATNGLGDEPWLLAMVANRCRSYRRSRWWRMERVAQPAPAVGDDARLKPEVLELRQALKRLPHDQRLVLILRYYLDQSFEDMATMLRTTPEAAKSRTKRALRRLRIEVPEGLLND